MEPAHLDLFSFPPIHTGFAKASCLPPPKKRKVDEEKRTKRTFVTTLWSHSWRCNSERAFLRPRPSHAVPLVRAKPPLPLIPSAGTSSSGKARVERRMRNENSVCATRAQNKEKVRERDVIPILCSAPHEVCRARKPAAIRLRA